MSEKYDDYADAILLDQGADVVLVAVLGGARRSGFSMSCGEQITGKAVTELPSVLR